MTNPVYSTCGATPPATPSETDTKTASYWKSQCEAARQEADKWKHNSRKWEARAKSNKNALKTVLETI